MNIQADWSDKAVLEELGQRLSRRRIAFRLSQADLAEQAGVGKRTVERIEAGESAQLTTLIRVFRILDLLPALDALIPAETIRPMALLEQGGRPRKRVRKSAGKARGSGAESSESSPWTWDES